MDFKQLARKYADGFDSFDPSDVPDDASFDDVRKLREDVTGSDVVRVSSDDFVPRASAKMKLPPRTFRYTMSTENPVGPFGDVVIVKGWDLADFKKRGQPFLYGHNIEAMRHPLGRMSDLKKGDPLDFVRKQPVLAGNGRFTDEGINPFNDLTHDMVLSDAMPAGSVGFRQIDARGPTDDELATNKGLRKWSAIVTKAGLVEFSGVPVGMDPDAVKRRSAALEGIEASLMRAIESGKYDEELIARWRHAYLGTDGEPANRVRAAVQVNGLRQLPDDPSDDRADDDESREGPVAIAVDERDEDLTDEQRADIDLDDISDDDADLLDEIEAEQARLLLDDDELEDGDPDTGNDTERDASAAARAGTDTAHGTSPSSDSNELDLTDTMRALEALGMPVTEDELREQIARDAAEPEAEPVEDMQREHATLVRVIGEQQALIESLERRIAAIEGVFLPPESDTESGDGNASRADAGDDGDPDGEDVYAYIANLDDAGLSAFVTTP